MAISESSKRLSTLIEMNIERYAAFSDGAKGGNPAGVVLCDTLPEVAAMQHTAKQVGYSETVFACPTSEGWRARYFAPELEVPFCGHATIALGASLARHHGTQRYSLQLNDTSISVDGECDNGRLSAALQSPLTSSHDVDARTVAAFLQLFGYAPEDVDRSIPPAIASAGAKHYILAVNSRAALRAMTYDFNAGRELMSKFDVTTILVAYAESDRLFHTRNAFARGGVYEDPATGAGTAALAGYLRDNRWLTPGQLTVIQGEDMGCRSLLHAHFEAAAGSSIRVAGEVRPIATAAGVRAE